jgi:hypothetical protein
MLAAIALVAVGGASVPANAAPVSVKFVRSIGTKLPIGALCQLTVPAGSNGLVVLDKAVKKHCITSYKAKYFPGFGHFVDCIDRLCSIFTPTYVGYWAMYENGAYTTYGVDDFKANAGDTLMFVYTH